MAIIKINPQESFSDENLTDIAHFKSIQDIYKQAENWNIVTSPFDIKGFLLKNGIRIIEEEMGSDCSGYIEKRVNNWVIGINKYQTLKRQRFTLAHEFAHFLYDRQDIERDGKLEDLILFRDDGRSNSREQRANEFAAQLLMPDKLFLHYLEKGIRQISDLSDKFNISLAAVRYRAYKLGYLKEY